MLQSLTFKNYKSFKDRTRLELKPITILVGTNSSGKSSIIKLLAMLHQSYTHPRKGELITYNGPAVDMGDFKTISHRNLGEPVEIGFRSKLFTFSDFYLRPEDPEIQVPRWGALDNEFELTLFDGFEECLFLDLESSNSTQVTGTKPDNRTIDCDTQNVPSLVFRSTKLISSGVKIQPRIFNRSTHTVGSGSVDLFLNWINDDLPIILEIFKWGYGAQFTLAQMIRQLTKQLNSLYWMVAEGLRFSKLDFNNHYLADLPPIPKFDHRVKKLPQLIDESISFSPLDTTRTWPKNIANALNSGRFEKYKHLLTLQAWGNLTWEQRYFFYREILRTELDEGEPVFDINTRVNNLRWTMEKELGGIHFLGPLRSMPRRYYSAQELQDLIFGTDIVFQLTDDDLERIAATVSRDLTELGADYTFGIRRTSETNYLSDLFSLSLTDNKSDTSQSYSDVGFGLSQIIPILIRLRTYDSLKHSDPFIIIEQPELHLHPRSQARLANLFTDWLKSTSPDENWKQLLLETHSEHLVRGFQVRVAKGQLSPDDVAIYYVDKDEEGNSFVKLMPLDEYGSFTEPWPEGFFDQAYLEALELLSAQE